MRENDKRIVSTHKNGREMNSLLARPHPDRAMINFATADETSVMRIAHEKKATVNRITRSAERIRFGCAKNVLFHCEIQLI